MDGTIRLARAEDVERINEIYNHYVRHSTCTYQEAPEPLESRRRWFEGHGAAHPVTVAEVEERVVGWGSLSPYHTRSAYRFSTENSIYVDHEHQRRGIGRGLLQDLVARATTIGYRTIIAGIDADQPASLAIHAAFGFRPVARFVEVGYKFGRWLDVVYMQKMLAGRD